MKQVFTLRKEDFIRNLTIAAVWIGLFHFCLGNWAEVGATIISSTIGIPIARWYLKRRGESLANAGGRHERDVAGAPGHLSR
ncbi:hypothetical protein AYO38_10055 [bacterium SCGC AG-212-C10]|nr:hypothetical protein AYO38_10055 [bacterium SCGC AG-212-C10]